MTSRERVVKALHHQEPDLVPMDLGGSAVTGMHASSVYRLRQALGLDAPGTPVKVVEPYQMLGEIQADLRAALSPAQTRIFALACWHGSIRPRRFPRTASRSPVTTPTATSTTRCRSAIPGSTAPRGWISSIRR